MHVFFFPVLMYFLTRSRVLLCLKRIQQVALRAVSRIFCFPLFFGGGSGVYGSVLLLLLRRLRRPLLSLLLYIFSFGSAPSPPFGFSRFHNSSAAPMELPLIKVFRKWRSYSVGFFDSPNQRCRFLLSLSL